MTLNINKVPRGKRGAAVKAARDNEGRTPHEICKIIADLPEFGGNYAEAEKFYNSMIRNLETSTWMERMRAELCGLFVGLKFPEILLDSHCQKRVRNALDDNRCHRQIFDKFLMEYQVACNEIIRTPNLGSKTVDMLRSLCEKLTGQLLHSWGFSDA